MDPETESITEAARTASSWTGVERRRADRRSAPTRPWSGLWTPLRRTTGRRASDREGYVDRYTRQDVILLLTIFLLNVGDAFFTMIWLGRGGREANPIMDFFLDIGPWAFLAQKCLVVGLWLVILVVHKNFRLARIGLYSALVVYGALMIVHFGIVAFGIEPPRPPAQEQRGTSPALEEPALEGPAIRGSGITEPRITWRAGRPGRG